MEKRLREFVVDYENNSLYKELGVSVPDVPDVPVKPSGTLPDFLSAEEETETIPVSSRGTSGTSGTESNSEKKSPSEKKQPVQSVLTKENFELALEVLHEETKDKPFATIQELEATTKINKEDLKQVLGKLQEEGKATQPHPDMWELVK